MVCFPPALIELSFLACKAFWFQNCYCYQYVRTQAGERGVTNAGKQVAKGQLEGMKLCRLHSWWGGGGLRLWNWWCICVVCVLKPLQPNFCIDWNPSLSRFAIFSSQFSCKAKKEPFNYPEQQVFLSCCCLLLIEENLKVITWYSWHPSYTMLEGLVKELCVHQGWAILPSSGVVGAEGKERTLGHKVWLFTVSALGTAWLLQDSPGTEELQELCTAAEDSACTWTACGEGDRLFGYLTEKLTPFLRKWWNGACRTTVNPAVVLKEKVSFFPLNGESHCNS